ncbi:asparaginyl-tRNA synthetase [Nannocystis exedens]|uniref:Asparagine--tRNA ligase n=1 Tax=Nannocystis exedens TaxID=54 RepID=A0A1I1WRV6_9BACT|nr:asparagine--tRNA ligase [Nannocystis exedens]PCC71045.1 asparagine-tRNA ligase [Nannocystis exedens]SFD97866.1 asparaginyl-tRNA synthetase [Nannocystis exedens]
MQTPRTKIVDVLRLEPPRAGVRVKGWARTVRDSKQVVFIELNDGSCFASLQVVVNPELANYEQLRKLTTGSAVEVVGEVIASPAAGQRVELKAAEVTVVGLADSSFPLQKKRHSFEFLREIAHLRARTNTFGAVFRVRSALAQAVHEFFQQRGFVYVHTPIITGSDAEGAGEMFRVTTLDVDKPPRTPEGAVDWHEDFFARSSFLTVSGQLNGETFALGLSDIYTFGPTFRAENSNTARHAAEFWMIEPEMAWYDLDDNTTLAEAFVKHLMRTALERCADDLAFFNKQIDQGLVARLQHVLESSFERMTYTEAVRRLEASGQKFEFPVHWGANLQAEHERYLTETVVGRPVFVTDYPTEIKAFYMRRNDDGKTVAAMDLLVPKIGELIGGSQREERLDVLMAAIRSMNLNPEHYGWYLDTRRFGTAPHSGFGLGFERLVMYVTGMENIRDVIPFPRTPRNCEF